MISVLLKNKTCNKQTLKQKKEFIKLVTKNK